MSITRYDTLAATPPAALLHPNPDLSNRLRAQLETLSWPGTLDQYAALARESIFATEQISQAHDWMAKHGRLKRKGRPGWKHIKPGAR